MPIRVAIQMDPIGSIHLPSDSTFVLALEAMARGHELFTYQPDTLTWRPGRLLATGRRVKALRREPGNHVDEGELEAVDLADFDVVLIRQDPPFDMGYVTTTHLLELLPASTLVVNDPQGIRDSPEKVLVLRFAEWMPPTLVANRPEDVVAFQAEFGRAVVKPLYGHGGNGVFLLSEGDPNLEPVLGLLGGSEPVIVQQYVPSVTEEGDRRIILVEGEPVGAIDRIPKPGDIRSNLVAGGSAQPAVLCDRDREICNAIGPELRRRGLLLAGIDVIGGRITEINVTSPTGIPAIERFDGISVGARFWDAVSVRRATQNAG
ncbi:MAG: glutathione synthase [Rhodospirillales bacterium]|nr:glutathione synthase [Rhodospirillales bacterium]